MNEARYPSKERVERDGVLIYAEGDDLVNDPDEMARQGYSQDEIDAAEPVYATERVEVDGVLVHAEGDLLDPADAPARKSRKAGADKAEKPADDK